MSKVYEKSESFRTIFFFEVHDRLHFLSTFTEMYSENAAL